MSKEDTITLSELEQIAEKINSIQRPLDFGSCIVPLDEREDRIAKALGTIGRYALHNEFKRMNDKILNHHHVTLNMVDGVQYRKNDCSIPSADPAFEKRSSR